MRLAFFTFVCCLFAPHFAAAQSFEAAPSMEGAGGGLPANAAAEHLHRLPTLAPRPLPINGFPLLLPAPVPGASLAALAAPKRPRRAVPASAGSLRRKAKTTYYEIEGTSRKAISNALEQRGPRRAGRLFYGLTEWEVSATYRPREQSTGCGIDDLTVHANIETHLPRWAPDGSRPELQDAWSRFIRALDEHEDGHRVLAEQASDAIRARMLTTTAETCDEIEQAAQQAIEAVMLNYNLRHRAYDQTTGHGRSQGATWPPPAFD